ncbi:hypothetical protein BGZ83_002629 [Gryganskiella cystojenkinii]|nr:hypothetical protein BGZ83_002629 [Gryganskiella cystojenkinii]
MHIKTLALAVVATATVSSVSNAQTFENNPCTQCAFQSLGNDTNCAALSTDQMGQLQTAFNLTSVNFPLLTTLMKTPAIKTCVCDWGQTVFSSPLTGPASNCTSGLKPICSANQTAQAVAGIRGALPLLGCQAAATSAPGPSATTPGASKPTNGGMKTLAGNLPYVLSVAAIGLAIAIGF